jgi:hypothetical protein
MTPAAQGDPAPPSVLLVPLLEHLSGLFHMEVLRRLGATDLASLAETGRGFAAAVAPTALMQWAKHAKSTAPVGHFGYPPTPAGNFGHPLLPLCLTEACPHAARDGNLEVLEWLYTTGCPLGDSASMCQVGAYTRSRFSST